MGNSCTYLIALTVDQLGTRFDGCKRMYTQPTSSSFSYCTWSIRLCVCYHINILNATLAAMTRAYDQLCPLPSVALVDGNRSPKLSCRVKTVIGGDGLSLSIAAASINERGNPSRYEGNTTQSDFII